MPGVKIGRGSFVGSGVVLDKDIPGRNILHHKTITHNALRNNKSVASGPVGMNLKNSCNEISDCFTWMGSIC